tara:strand:+ start:182 stop:418 length:237 start_codon:yes stop_codon:yes gene_type:complete
MATNIIKVIIKNLVFAFTAILSSIIPRRKNNKEIVKNIKLFSNEVKIISSKLKKNFNIKKINKFEIIIIPPVIGTISL